MPQYLIADPDAGYGWSHIFAEKHGGRVMHVERMTRFAIDVETEEFAHLDVDGEPGSEEDKKDLLESLHHNDAFEEPQTWGLVIADRLPAWAAV